jgi:hypothetical protein
VFNLSLALDHAIWRLDPVGYRISSALWFGACGMAVYGLAAQLLGRRAPLGALVTLVAFLAGPFHMEVVAILSRRMDLIAGTFIALALASQMKRLDRPMPQGALIPALFTLLAIGAKEIAAIIPPLVFLVMFTYGPPGGLAARGRRSLRTALPHLGAVLLAVAARLAALGHLGGHINSQPLGSITRLPLAAGLEMKAFFGSAVPRGTPPAVLGMLLLLLTLGFLFATLRSTRERRPKPILTFTVALTWLIGTSSIFGTVGFVQPWYLFVPWQAFALCVGAAAQACLSMTASVHRPRALAGASGVALSLAAVAFLLWSSPLVRPAAHWKHATEVVNAYLEPLETELGRASVRHIPHPLPPMLLGAKPNAAGVRWITPLTVYSVQAWADLMFPDRVVLVVREESDTLLEPRAEDVVVVELRKRLRRPPANSNHRPR